MKAGNRPGLLLGCWVRVRVVDIPNGLSRSGSVSMARVRDLYNVAI